jgi:hypothetical protein
VETLFVPPVEAFVQKTNPSIYKWGDRILFGRAGNAVPLQESGWSEQSDQQSTWTDGPEAQLGFRTLPPPADILLSFAAAPFLQPGTIEQQDVTVFFNYFRVGYFEIDRFAEQSILLPRELFIMRVARLCFHLSSCASPRKLGLGMDVRRLGLAFQWIILQPAS